MIYSAINKAIDYFKLFVLQLFLNVREKKVYTLGLCTMSTSSAALFKNGTLIAAVEEERLSRKKIDTKY